MIFATKAYQKPPLSISLLIFFPLYLDTHSWADWAELAPSRNLTNWGVDSDRLIRALKGIVVISVARAILISQEELYVSRNNRRDWVHSLKGVRLRRPGLFNRWYLFEGTLPCDLYHSAFWEMVHHSKLIHSPARSCDNRKYPEAARRGSAIYKEWDDMFNQSILSDNLQMSHIQARKLSVMSNLISIWRK